MDKHRPSMSSDQFAESDMSQRKVLCIETDIDLEEVAVALPYINTIRVQTHSFTDGRIFSIGYSLRQQYGFRGNLIASGDILPDQANYLRRCGFDEIDSDIKENVTDSDVLRGYQPAHYSG